ncbi:leucyl/phenylalanyl-tRNA--protein transferase [Cyclobacteriaceae bacterium]|nr:leucyl/phenylalanyl-tRNA--protein transferase [Cyclobacteriaceae bacterium]
MPIFQLNNELEFPPVELTESDGLLAVGGDLSVERLLLAYQKGLFPWFNEDDPILWWSPDPRFVLYPNKLHISRSMRRKLNQKAFRVTINMCFDQVIANCKSVGRKEQEGTWITDEMKAAYTELHKLGFAHSVEVWQGEQLVGGMYGVAMGKCFFGESMFSLVANASKYGFIKFVQFLEQHNFELLDAQVHTDHVESLGATHVSRDFFVKMLPDTIIPPQVFQQQSTFELE